MSNETVSEHVEGHDELKSHKFAIPRQDGDSIRTLDKAYLAPVQLPRFSSGLLISLQHWHLVQPISVGLMFGVS